MSKTALIKEVRELREKVELLEDDCDYWKRHYKSEQSARTTVLGHANRIATQFTVIIECCKSSGKWPTANYLEIMNWGRIQHLIEIHGYKT